MANLKPASPRAVIFFTLPDSKSCLLQTALDSWCEGKKASCLEGWTGTKNENRDGSSLDKTASLVVPNWVASLLRHQKEERHCRNTGYSRRGSARNGIGNFCFARLPPTAPIKKCPLLGSTPSALERTQLASLWERKKKGTLSETEKQMLFNGL